MVLPLAKWLRTGVVFTENLAPVLVKLMGCGPQMNLTVKVVIKVTINDSASLIFIAETSTSINSSYTCTDNSGVVGGVTAVVLITISMVIIALLIGYIVYLRRQLKQQQHKE